MTSQKRENPSTGIFRIECIKCKNPVAFSLVDLESKEDLITTCSDCGKKYAIDNEFLRKQLLQFAKLCREIQASEEILGNAQIAVDVGPHSIKIPFKILLTRLKSILDLQIGDSKVTVTFRTEPVALPKSVK